MFETATLSTGRSNSNLSRTFSFLAPFYQGPQKWLIKEDITKILINPTTVEDIRSSPAITRTIHHNNPVVIHHSPDIRSLATHSPVTRSLVTRNPVTHKTHLTREDSTPAIRHNPASPNQRHRTCRPPTAQGMIPKRAV